MMDKVKKLLDHPWSPFWSGAEAGSGLTAQFRTEARRRIVEEAHGWHPERIGQATLPQPVPMPTAVALGPAEGMDEYLNLAVQLGVASRAVAAELLRAVLAELVIPVYPSVDVERFLIAEGQKLNLQVEWRGLRSQDCCPGRGRQLYQEAVPMRVLRRVARIVERLPEAKFLVSAFAVPKADPFLAVEWGLSDLLVVDHWDEPGFGLPVVPEPE